MANAWMDERELGAESVDEAWLKDEIERRREHWVSTRRQLNLERLMKRKEMNLRQRVANLLCAIASLQTLRAGSVATSSPSSEADFTPQSASELELAWLERKDVERLVRESISGSEDSIYELEAAYDWHCGQTLRINIFAESRDKIVVQEFAGFAPRDIVAIDPSLGDKNTIRAARMKVNLNPETGLPDEATR